MVSQEEIERVSYRGKHFTVPALDSDGGCFIEPNPQNNKIPAPADSLVIQTLNAPFDLRHFKRPRRPVSLGLIEESRRPEVFKVGVPRILDLPIKFPGSNYRLPAEVSHLSALVQKVADYEAAINSDCYDEYYCYLTVDHGVVKPGTLQREAPCHVDGFQGARWNPKVRSNHTYTVSDVIPTVYYDQPFDFDLLEESKHNFFWEMNRQVAMNNSAQTWRPQPCELTLMDCYCVHRGDECVVETLRTFLRLSFEVRIFDRQGNAHNPLFRYDWPMVPRDIEALNLVPFDPGCDPSLRVFPWQKTTGESHEDARSRTKPNLRPRS